MSRIAPPKDLELTHYRKHVLEREREKKRGKNLVHGTERQ